MDVQKLTGRLLLCAMLIFPVGNLMAQSSDPIQNGDFETGSASPWTKGVEPLNVSSSTVRAGKFALEIGENDGMATQKINLRPSSQYKLSGYVKTSSGASVIELSANVNKLRTSVASALTSWTYKELFFITGPADSSVIIEINFPRNTRGNSAWADDIHVSYAGPHAASAPGGIKPLPLRIPKEDLGIQQQPDEKLRWLQDGKFGLFIHWGLYSGEAQGEWYMNWGKAPIEQYRKLAFPESGDKQFTADRFHAEDWARLAKDAGMKYMNLTAMHHDGFALFDSKYPNAFTAQQTLGRDLVAEYIHACRKEGLRVGLYKTLINWRYPGYYDIEGTGSGPYFNAANNWKYKGDTSHRENARIMKEELFFQTKELMTNYGKIDQIFWDGGWLGERTSDADAAFFWEPGKYRDLQNRWPVDNALQETEKSSGRPLGLMGMIRKYQPDILVNPRSGWRGDYLSEEGASPITGPVRTTDIYEKTFSLHESWGYEKHAEDPSKIMTAHQVERQLSDCIIRNMSLLVNVGPDRHGTIPKAEADVLREVGLWLGKVGEAVYGTRGGPWNPTDGQFGYSYRDKTIYVYLYPAYASTEFKLPSVDARRAIKVYNVFDKKPLKFSQHKNNEITVTGIDRVQHPEVTVIAIQLDKKIMR